MASWKDNKSVGIIAVVIVIIMVALIFKSLTGKEKITKEQQKEIDRIQQLADEEIQRMEEMEPQ